MPYVAEDLESEDSLDFKTVSCSCEEPGRGRAVAARKQPHPGPWSLAANRALVDVHRLVGAAHQSLETVVGFAIELREAGTPG